MPTPISTPSTRYLSALAIYRSIYLACLLAHMQSNQLTRIGLVDGIKTGNTPLHLACIYGSWESVVWLLNHGALDDLRNDVRYSREPLPTRFQSRDSCLSRDRLTRFVSIVATTTPLNGLVNPIQPIEPIEPTQSVIIIDSISSRITIVTTSSVRHDSSRIH